MHIRSTFPSVLAAFVGLALAACTTPDRPGQPAPSAVAAIPPKVTVVSSTEGHLRLVYERGATDLRIDVDALASGSAIARYRDARGALLFEAIADGPGDAIRLGDRTVRVGDPLTDGERAALESTLRQRRIVTAAMAVFDLACKDDPLPRDASLVRALAATYAVLHWVDAGRYPLERFTGHLACADADRRLAPWLTRQRTISRIATVGK